jgi:hypothetical protein
MIKTTVFVLLFVGSCLIAQSGQAQSQPSTKVKGQVTIQGCVSRQSGDYILTQSDQLRASRCRQNQAGPIPWPASEGDRNEITDFERQLRCRAVNFCGNAHGQLGENHLQGMRQISDLARQRTRALNVGTV